MLCVYFEIPYEQQLIRVVPNEMQTVLHTLAEMAESNGAGSFKIPCATVYRFSSSEVAPLFSVNLFLQFLADILRTYKKRIMDYRIIVDYCSESDTDDSIADHFATYKHLLIPGRGFFVSPKAERLLRAYINVEYMSNLKLYYCVNFIAPKIDTAEASEKVYTIYIPDNMSWIHALYHFMLLHPLSEQTIKENLSEQDKKQYEETKNAQRYFRKHRFLPTYPNYFIDAFLIYTQLYFRVFIKCHGIETLSIVCTEKSSKEVAPILQVIPNVPITPLEIKSVNLEGVSLDFMQLAYLVIYASRFIFEDEIQTFFLSLHKSSVFVTRLYEWMYAAGIIAVKNNIYSMNSSAVSFLEQQLGAEKDKVKTYIAAFLWGQYKKGMLCPDEDLKNVFLTFKFEPDASFFLHYFFYKYSDQEIPQVDIQPFKSSVCFTALESYQKALRISEQNNAQEALDAIKSAVNAIQKYVFPAGEFRALSRIAFLHLSQNKIEDAVTYFHYALDSAETLQDSRFICDALFNLGVGCFLQNNLNTAINYFTCLQQTAAGSFELPQIIPCLFMQGRIALQLGDYNQAERLFQDAGDAAALHFEKWEPLCRIWYARALSQKGQTGKAQKLFISYMEDSPDALLFLIESFLFAPVIRNEPSYIPSPPLPFTAGCEPYKSGFALAEELVWGKLYDKPAMQMFYTAMDSYYRFSLASIVEKDKDTAKACLQELEDTARKALRHRDMHAPLYSYLCYDAFLKSEGPDSDTANGYLSRSFKALQNCMNNMTENSIRDTFIFRNVWNAKLHAVAQKNKLI